MSKNVLVVAPHPDDETLGCGGSLLKHIANGDLVYWLIVTNALPNKYYNWSNEMISKRQEEIESVSKFFGFEKTFKLDFPTTELDMIPMYELIGSISDVIIEVHPEVIYLPNRSDVHTDHQITFKAAYSCTKNFRYPFIKRILMYETLSETEFAPALPEYGFIPNVFSDTSDFYKRKIEILEIYKSEIMKSPLPRSIGAIQALAKYRGSRIGCDFAEAFQLIFEKN